MTEIFYQVYQHPMLSLQDIEDIRKRHEQMEIKRGNLLLKEGAIANEYYILESGLMRSFVYDYDGNEITTDFFTEGDLVIIPTSLFQRIPSQENLQALTDAVLWRVGFDDFQELFHSIPGFTEWGRDWFTTQLFVLKQRTLEMITLNSIDRYKNLLDQKPQIIQSAPLKQIASFLGVTDTSLSRIRKELAVQ